MRISSLSSIESRKSIGLGTGFIGQSTNINQLYTPKPTIMIEKKEIVKEEQKMMAEVAKLNSLSIRYQKFKNILEQPNVDFDQLRKLAWPGIPDEIRPTVWKLLMVITVNIGVSSCQFRTERYNFTAKEKGI
jgi:hypothetical protein